MCDSALPLSAIHLVVSHSPMTNRLKTLELAYYKVYLVQCSLWISLLVTGIASNADMGAYKEKNQVKSPEYRSVP